MELVEGPTLADRIADGPIPVDEALSIARQIAEALEAAHEQGIIHRDLKPANIKVRPDGTVKVLDFGLAKAMEPAGGLSPGFSMSPTITTPAMTAVGPDSWARRAYMSPEQAKGKPADKRADIWAFGVVFCEMFTGQQLFTGETATEILAGVIKDEPQARHPARSCPSDRRTLSTSRPSQTLAGHWRRAHRARGGRCRDANSAGLITVAVLGDSHVRVDRRELGRHWRRRACVRSPPRNAASAQHRALPSGAAREVVYHEFRCFSRREVSRLCQRARRPAVGPPRRFARTRGHCREPTERPLPRTRYSGHRTADSSGLSPKAS